MPRYQEGSIRQVKRAAGMTWQGNEVQVTGVNHSFLSCCLT